MWRRHSPSAPAVPDTVIRQLGPLPDAAGGSTVADALTTAYTLFTTAAEARAFGEAPVATPSDANGSPRPGPQSRTRRGGHSGH